MIVELAVWLAASVLLCDHVLLRPALFAFHLGREVIDPPPEGRLATRAAVGRGSAPNLQGLLDNHSRRPCGPGHRPRRRTVE